MQPFFNPLIPDFCSAEWKFTKSAKELPKAPGIYAIYASDNYNTCLYVGKTSRSLYGRVFPPSHKAWYTALKLLESPVICYRVLLLTDENEFYLQEHLAIGILRPLWNHCGVFWEGMEAPALSSEGFPMCELNEQYYDRTKSHWIKEQKRIDSIQALANL